MDDDRPEINWGLEPVDPTSIAALELIEKRKFLDLLLAGKGPLPAGLEIGWSPLHINKMLQDPEIQQLMSVIEENKDQSVEYALYKAAMSGNVTAQQVWLFNRRGQKWRDVKRVVHEGEVKVAAEVIHSVRQVALGLLESHGVEALQPGGALDEIVIDLDEPD